MSDRLSTWDLNVSLGALLEHTTTSDRLIHWDMVRKHIDALETENEALRKRNEKLERVAALARKLPGRRVGQTPYIVLFNEILVALSDLDKEDA